MKSTRLASFFRVAAAGDISHFTTIVLMYPCSFNTVKIHSYPVANLHLTEKSRKQPIISYVRMFQQSLITQIFLTPEPYLHNCSNFAILFRIQK